MKRFTLKAIVYVVLCFVGVRTQAQDVLTQRNDLNRTGWYQNETTLTQSNVTPTSFGLLYKKMVDDQIYAQPLYAQNIMINGALHNVVYVATVSNSVYAFDADDGTLDPYWQVNTTMAGKMVPNNTDIHADGCNAGYTDFQGASGFANQKGSFGIVGTPVIDKIRNSIYFVSRSRDLTLSDNPSYTNDFDWPSTGFYQQLHALSLSTGNDTLGSPVNIDNSISVPGTGDGRDGSNLIHFDPRRENQRTGLVLYNNVVYVTYGSHCDWDYYHGWIFGFNAANLALVTKYITTPNDGRGGIWMSAAAPAVDASGNFYFAAGNALAGNDGTSPGNMGLRIVKAKPAGGTFTNLSWFKPLSYETWNASDLDFGTGLILIPSADMLVTAQKSGNLVSLKENQTVSGEFNENDHTNFLGYTGLGGAFESHSGLSYYGGTSNQWIYQFSENTNVTAYPVIAGTGLGAAVKNSTIPTNTGFNGGFTSVSSNGSSDASSILWVEHITTSGGALVALKANDITKQLWSSDALAVDNLGKYAKMNWPTIANGRVYAPTFSNNLNVYGLLATNDRCVTNIAVGLPAANYASLPNAGSLPASNAFDGNMGTRWAIGGSAPQYLYVNLGARFDICKISIHWNSVNGSFSDYARGFTVDISDDGVTWTNLETETANFFSSNPAINEYNENSTGKYVRVNITQGGQGGTSITEFQVFGSPANTCIAPTALTANPTQNSAVLSWAPVSGANQYFVRYKSGPVFSYISRTVPNTGNPVTLNISALTCGFPYTYEVTTDCGSGSLSDPATFAFNADPCSSPCTNAQHFDQADLGDIKLAGMSCYDGISQTFTVTGSGSGLSGKTDQFQFEYKALSVDEDITVHVASQDQVAPSNSNLAGLMMRDSLTDISRYIFIGKTGDNSKIYLIYRTSPGGTAQSSFIARPAGMDYFRLSKSGSQFNAYYANSNIGPWNLMGTQTIGFVGPTSYNGMAVSSMSTTATSTATFDNLDEGSIPLPVQLLNFTASNVSGTYSLLKWQTAMEVNNDHFDIERSSDGTHFFKILTVKGVGNSDTLQSYSAIDNTPLKGINFYRLKQVDRDNHFSYSPVQIVKFGAGVSPVVYPNPVGSLFTAVPGSEPIQEIVIYNVQGRVVQYAMNNNSGNEMQVNISPLASGIYFLKLKTDSKVYQVKIVKE